jgi:hydroxylamine reductase (hybrid-cluster protein)
MMGTEFTDIMFGTPTPKDTEADLGVLEKDMVNIIVHGHDPVMSEMIVLASEDKELLNYARSKGAKGINIGASAAPRTRWPCATASRWPATSCSRKTPFSPASSK